MQYQIFKRLFAGCPLVLIGDPKQAIYGFRGADVFAYIEAKQDAQHLYTLERNWRSSQVLVEAINAVFLRPQRTFVYDSIPFSPATAADRSGQQGVSDQDGPPLRWLWLGRASSKPAATEHAADVVAAEIVRLLSSPATLGGRGLTPGDCAVLVRTNEQARIIESALRKAGVPCVVNKAGNIFHSEEMRELTLLLRAIIDTGSHSSVRAALSTRLWGASASDIDALAVDDAAWQRLVDRLDEYRTCWTR